VGRGVAETDIVNFCGVSGDFNQLHSDNEFVVKSAFAQRVAHGICGVVIASGCIKRAGILEGTTVAFKEIKGKLNKF
jgi:acyl dehydratase